MHRRRFLAILASLPLVRLRSGAPRLLAFGDSITVGDGASAYARGWAQLVANQCGLTLDNRAVSGTLLADHARAIAAAEIGAGDTVLWLTGYNDMRVGTPLEEYRSGLRVALGLIPGAYIGTCLRMPEASYAIVPNNKGSDGSVAQFNAIIAEEVRAAGCVLIDASAAYDPANCDDLVHPNDAGHAQIARAFLAAMRRVVVYVPTIGH